MVCAISTHMKEIVKEINKLSLFPNSPVSLVLVNDQLGKLAAASQNVIRFAKIADWTELPKETIELPSECGNITKMCWSTDGQILVVSTNRGHVLGYLMSFPTLFDTSNGIAALQTSLTEVTLLDCINKNNVLGTISLDAEPAYIKLSAAHLAIGAANTVYFYRFVDENRQMLADKKLVNKKDYFGTVKMLTMNSRWAAVLSEKKCILHEIEQAAEHPSEDRKFPANETEKGIVYIALTEDFLLMLDEAGKLRYYYIEANSIIAEYKPDNPVVKVFPNDSGTKTICIDSTGCGILYNPVNGTTITLPNFSANTEKVLWDIEDQNTFCTFEREKVLTYLYVQYSLEGSTVIHLPEFTTFEEIETHSAGNVTYIAPENQPVLLKNGYLFHHSKEGLKGMYLPTHSVIESWREDDPEEAHLRYYLQNIALNRFEACFKVAKLCVKYSAQLYEILGRECLKHLELGFAERAYQLCKNPGMVLAIQSIKSECEKFVLMGHMALLLHKHDMAEEFFLKSSRPELALEMRCDLNDWPSALKLAEKLATDKVPFIAVKVGQYLEVLSQVAYPRRAKASIRTLGSISRAHSWRKAIRRTFETITSSAMPGSPAPAPGWETSPAPSASPRVSRTSSLR